MKLIRRIACVILAGMLTVYSAGATWSRIDYLPDAGRAVDPQPWKTIWLVLSIGVVLCTPTGVVGMWITFFRRSYGWMAVFIALQLLFPLIVGALQRDVML
jgi:hypothetical protein